MDDTTLLITGMVADLQGNRLIRKELRGDPQQPEVIGTKLAEEVLEAGGQEILSEIYSGQQE